MIKSLYSLPERFDLYRLQAACTKAFSLLNGVMVRAWPEIGEWIDDIVPEDFGPEKQSFEIVRILDKSSLERMLSPELTTLYEVKSPNAFVTILLASLRHSEFPGVFLPIGLGQRRVTKLLHAADYYDFERHQDEFPIVKWMIGIGITQNEPDSFLLMTESKELMKELDLTFLAPPNGEGVFCRWGRDG